MEVGEPGNITKIFNTICVYDTMLKRKRNDCIEDFTSARTVRKYNYFVQVI